MTWNTKIVSRAVRVVLGHVLAAVIIILCLPADFLAGSMLVVNHSTYTAHSAPVPAAPSESAQALAFLFWLDAGFVGSYGLQLCMAAAILWLVLVLAGRGLVAKLVPLPFLIPSIIMVCAQRLSLHLG